MGADAPACAALAGGADVKAFFVRKEAKAHGLQRRIEGPPLEPGERCLIVEDVVTTGGSTVQAIEAVRAEGLRHRAASSRSSTGWPAAPRRSRSRPAARPTSRSPRSTTSTRTARPLPRPPGAGVLEALDLSAVELALCASRGDRGRGRAGYDRLRLRAPGRPDAALLAPSAIPVTPLTVAMPMVLIQAVVDRRGAGLPAGSCG